MKQKEFIYDLSVEELSSYLTELGFSAYRAKQIFHWLYKKNIVFWEDMLNIPVKLRDILNNNFDIFSISLLNNIYSKQNDSIKFLLKTRDDNFIETVNIINPKRNTICLSTQIGCKYNCKFCASGQKGFFRNLSCGEIMEQYQVIRKNTRKKITNIVFMGMGEPFDNYDNLLKAINKLIFDVGFSQKKITISTSGIIPQIKRFVNDFPNKINLSLSLHAVDNKKRNKIMPINKKYKVNDLLNVLFENKQNLKNRLTLEYILIDNFNMTHDDALELANIAKKLKAKVNLIRYNRIKDSGFKSPSIKGINTFNDILNAKGIVSTIRHSVGNDIAAACGQLSMNVENNPIPLDIHKN